MRHRASCACRHHCAYSLAFCIALLWQRDALRRASLLRAFMVRWRAGFFCAVFLAMVTFCLATTSCGRAATAASRKRQLCVTACDARAPAKHLRQRRCGAPGCARHHWHHARLLLRYTRTPRPTMRSSVASTAFSLLYALLPLLVTRVPVSMRFGAAFCGLRRARVRAYLCYYASSVRCLLCRSPNACRTPLRALFTARLYA